MTWLINHLIAYRQLRPENDTTAIFYTALAATNAGEKDPKVLSAGPFEL